jgi:hypothetical protein
MTIKFNYSFNQKVITKHFASEEKLQKWYEKNWAGIYIISIT